MSADLLGDRQLTAFARKVSLHHDAGLDAEFPARAGARLVVHTSKGALSKEVQHPRGDPDNPLSGEELTSKFHKLAGTLAGPEKAQAVVRAVMELKNAGAGGLFAALKELEVE
jgi:2-methylcitrate dehydratase PrpD